MKREKERGDVKGFGGKKRSKQKKLDIENIGELGKERKRKENTNERWREFPKVGLGI